VQLKPTQAAIAMKPIAVQIAIVIGNQIHAETFKAPHARL
jgi:hypothetical protein